MTRAGFYTIESGQISFRRDGNWYVDGELIDNPRISTLFSRNIHQAPDGSYFLQIGDERATVTVEDTPYVVRTVEGDSRSGFTLVLNDGEREPLDPASLCVGDNDVLYCSVKAQRTRARFLRPAYYHLSTCFEEDANGDIYFVVNWRRYPLLHSGKASGGQTTTDN
jgi:hypothetical protein